MFFIIFQRTRSLTFFIPIINVRYIYENNNLFIISPRVSHKVGHTGVKIITTTNYFYNIHFFDANLLSWG